ncbi:Protein-glutamate methylesterase/protein-glutamine glutaminase [Paenibacillus auburnensis]|uniref:Protein-glutamate methylesterase/protein-glutamine glutaminase n=1 Tax=Paenibacillus auburnensis TaxID=2905649 RepID=A0ABN8GYL2_9BACL|nr:response regulator transcription factor [Paenibacillus auburnensis]CAH1222083.1 Protein-glutamate methylesterase/protein-glutamine glutaminase [Paenibacillus auburnensis]
MIKVLIVDDEPKLREGLRTLIPWEEEGYTVVATAANGFEALEKFHTFAPGLVVADIRMPGMDGLELITELRKQNANCHVLILSGYADFEYAKRAISCHIDGYLLKPVDEEELISYLQELRVTIEREEQFSKLQTEAEVSHHEAWLRGLLQPGSEDITVPEAASRLGLQGESEVILLQLMRPLKGEDGREERVRSLLERYLPPERAIFFSLPPFLGFLLKEPLKDEAARTALWQELNRLIAKEGLDFYAASGGAAAEPEQAAASYTAARELLEQAFFGRREILVDGAVEQWAEAVEEPGELTDSERDEEMELLLAVETGSTEVLSPLVRQIICKLVETRHEEAYIKDNLIRIVSSTIARLEAVNPDVRTLISENASPASEVYNSYYLSDILSMVADYLEHIAKQLNTGGRGDEIKRITDLIQRRYNENLKLGMLAQIFNYNSAYLGKMFKNQIGEHFNTYLDKVRIEKAKQFLTQGMKVYEVAERVGYMNADYFNAKFRKYVGVSPSAFRKEQ